MGQRQKEQQAERKIVGILAITQVTSWGSLYYAFSILAPEIQRELGWRGEIVFGAFSWSLLVAGLVVTPAGIMIDRLGGRYVMGLGSLASGTGLLMLGMAHSPVHYFAAWTLLGLAMALTLYEAAFATINREFSANARLGMSALTLFGGFASTVFWPLTLKLNGALGWRDTYMLYGVVQLLLCLPLHALLGPGKILPAQSAMVANAATHDTQKNYTLNQALREPVFWKLAFAFAGNSFIFSALSVHLIPLLQQFGHAPAATVFFAALIGPLQVAGRIGEMVFAKQTLPQTAGKITLALMPVAILSLLVAGEQAWVIALFCLLYGLTNGVITIVRGTVPQALFGRENYGAIAGALAGPSLIFKAAGPLAAAAIIQSQPSPYPLLGVLFMIALVSLGFYLAAVKVSRPLGAPRLNETSM